MTSAIPTTRLVDYFAVIGFDDSKESKINFFYKFFDVFTPKKFLRKRCESRENFPTVSWLRLARSSVFSRARIGEWIVDFSLAVFTFLHFGVNYFSVLPTARMEIEFEKITADVFHKRFNGYRRRSSLRRLFIVLRTQVFVGQFVVVERRRRRRWDFKQ